MSRATSTAGTCSFCGQPVTKRGVAGHLAKCPDYQAVLHRAEQSKRKPERLFRLRVQDAYGGQFWLELELRDSASLQDLDDYLRAIWLECCGHMSQFSIGGWRGEEIPRSRRAASVFEPGIELTHIYDFGTESETRIKVADMRAGKPLDSHPIVLLARNVMPPAACVECGAPATHLCMECVVEHDRWGVLCDTHVKKHPHAEYGEPLPLVNSPRLGLCGYDGPAEPPYGWGRSRVA